MATDAAAFAELHAALARENYAKAVEICNKIRSKTPEDHDAIKIKTLALIRMDKFDKALELAAKYPFLASERAYCLYRLKKDEEALAALDANTASTAQLHLAAQLHFRRGDYAQAITIYEQLLAAAAPSDDVMELQTNLLAAYATAGRSRELTDRDIQVDDSYELAFNKSFIAIENQDWAQATALLQEAEKLCRDVFEGDANLDDELAIIRTQAAFVKQMRGDLDGALADYRTVLKLKLSNASVAAVATNNLVSIRADRDLLDSLKRLKTLEVSRDKLSPQQHEALLANRALVLCLLHKADELREALAALHAAFPRSRVVAEITVLLALQDQQPAQAIARLQTDLSLGAQLGLAHLYLAQGQYVKAAEVLDALAAIAHSPGTVATLVALYEAAGQPLAAQRVLANALAHHQSHGDLAAPAVVQLREGDAAFKIQRKQYQAAADAYLELLEGPGAAAMDPELRLQSLAALVVALSFSDAAAAQARSALLPPVAESDVDPVELEQQAQRSSRLASKLADAADKKNERKRAAKTSEQVARKRAKKREAHLAKLRAKPDYNASIGLVNPDPERWVPRKQRSYAKRGRRGRNRFVGAQGAGMGTDKDAAKLDAAARAARKAEEAPRAVVVSSDSSAVLRKASKKKKRR